MWGQGQMFSLWLPTESSQLSCVVGLINTIEQMWKLRLRAGIHLYKAKQLEVAEAGSEFRSLDLQSWVLSAPLGLLINIIGPFCV